MRLLQVAISTEIEPDFVSKPEPIDVTDCEKFLIAVIDGVGHGLEAAMATNKVIECIKNDYRLDLLSLVKACHNRARYSRGVALGIASIDIKRLALNFIGVGNVEMQLITSIANVSSLPLRVMPPSSVDPSVVVHKFITNNGIVGYRMPERLMTHSNPFTMEDIVVMYSDGIEQGYRGEELVRSRDRSAEYISETIMSQSARVDDDATLVVAK
jgi:hypothetical protein